MPLAENLDVFTADFGVSVTDGITTTTVGGLCNGSACGLGEAFMETRS